MNINKFILSSFAFVMMSQAGINAAKLDDNWFQTKAQECDEYVDTDLKLKDAPPINFGLSGGGGGVEGGFSIGIPTQLRKVFAPGYGKCCLYDRNGNLIPGKFKTMKSMSGKEIMTHISGSGRVSKGNDECQAWLRADRNAATAGLWWCVGPQTGCHMDWWRINK